MTTADEPIEPIVVDDGVLGEITVSVDRVRQYQERMEALRDRQRAAIDRLLLRISQLEERNKTDATTIAELTGELVEKDQALADLKVQYDRAVEERSIMANTLEQLQGFLKVREKDHTVDGDPISYAAEAVWDHRLAQDPPVDEADLALTVDELIIVSRDPTPPHWATPLPLGEDRPSHVL